jgi:hypothetical protein
MSTALRRTAAVLLQERAELVAAAPDRLLAQAGR